MRATESDIVEVVGYVRVSTDEQALGPEAQRAALDRWCAARGARLVAVHEDIGVSGGPQLDRRPGLLAALEELRLHRATVLPVAKRDRLARDVVIAGTVERIVEKHGARVLSADGASDGDGPEVGVDAHDPRCVLGLRARRHSWPDARRACCEEEPRRARGWRTVWVQTK